MKTLKTCLIFILICLLFYGCLKKDELNLKDNYFGIPIYNDENIKILKNKGFIVGYSEKRLNPAWVGYKVFKTNKKFPKSERPSHFMPDNRLSKRVEHEDYSHSGYDRGHLAPNYAITKFYGQKAQEQTFLTSDIAPQKHALNAGIWKKLEQKIANQYSNSLEEVWVLVGPLYDDRGGKRFLKNTKIQIPSHFFAIILDEYYGAPRSMAFIIPQSVHSKEKSLSKFLVSIDEIERRTGANFLHELEDNIENEIERKKEKQIWK